MSKRAVRRHYGVAVVGVTGAVGLEFLKILAQRRFPIKELRVFASNRSIGRYVRFKNSRLKVQCLTNEAFRGIDIAFFSAGGSVSKQWAPVAVRSGAVVVDNTSAFRMDPKTPLVVPEVNPQAIKKHRGIIANPNCSTIQMVVALKPLHDYARIKRVIVSTYQAVSGAGLKALDEMLREARSILDNRPFQRKIFPHQMAFNALPQIPQSAAFGRDGYTVEETKMMRETNKIMGDNSIKVVATCVRVPVCHSHSEVVNIETARPLSPAQARILLRKAAGVKLLDDPSREIYPLAVLAAGKDEVLVGRIRQDPTIKNGLTFWVVADNIRKGAALNAVQIAEVLIGTAGCRP